MKTRNKQQGFGLLEVLVAAVIGMLAVYGFLSSQRQSHKVIAQLHQRTDINELRFYIRNRLNCSETAYRNGTECNLGAFIPAFDKEGKEFIAADGSTRLGIHFGLRVKCLAGNTRALGVEAAVFEPSGSFARDPLTRKEQSWFPLFNQIPFACQENTPAVSPPPPPSLPQSSGSCLTDIKKTVGVLEIASALGLPANSLVLPIDFQVTLLCEKLGYSSVDSYQEKNKDSSCNMKKIALWRADTEAFQLIDACASKTYLSSATCRFQINPSCVNFCRDEFVIVHRTESYVTSHEGLPMGPLGGNTCVATDGALISGSGKPPSCCQLKNDAASRARVCQMLGYSTVKSFSTNDYSSCDDNTLAYYDAASGKFIAQNACAGGGKKFVSIICTSPQYPRCSRWYRKWP